MAKQPGTCFSNVVRSELRRLEKTNDAQTQELLRALLKSDKDKFHAQKPDFEIDNDGKIRPKVEAHVANVNELIESAWDDMRLLRDTVADQGGRLPETISKNIPTDQTVGTVSAPKVAKDRISYMDEDVAELLARARMKMLEDGEQTPGSDTLLGAAVERWVALNQGKKASYPRTRQQAVELFHRGVTWPAKKVNVERNTLTDPTKADDPLAYVPKVKIVRVKGKKAQARLKDRRELEAKLSLLEKSIGRGMPVAEVEAVAQLIGGKVKGVTFKVVELADDLPKKVRDEAESLGIDVNKARGVYHNGAVYMVAGNIETVRQAEIVALHEVYGHHGLQKMFGTNLKTAMADLYKAVGGAEGVRSIAARRGIDLSAYEAAYKSTDDAHHAAIMEELLAHLAQEYKGTSIAQKIKEVWGLIRAALNRIFGAFTNATEYELAVILRHARSHARAGRSLSVTLPFGLSSKLAANSPDVSLETTPADNQAAAFEPPVRFSLDVVDQLEDNREVADLLKESLKGADPRTATQRAKENAKSWVGSMVDGIKRHYVDLPTSQVMFAPFRNRELVDRRKADIKFFSKGFNILREFEQAPIVADRKAVSALMRYVQGLNPDEYRLLSLKVMAEDFKHDVDAGKETPYWNDRASFMRFYKKTTALAAKSSKVMRAFDERKKTIDKTRERLIEAGILKRENATNHQYFRHQVLAYAELFNRTGRKKVGTPFAPYKKHRVGTKHAINLDILEVDYGFLQMAETDIATMDAIRELTKVYGIKLKKGESAPEGYSKWHPSGKLRFFMGQAIGDKGINLILNSIEESSKDFKGVEPEVLLEVLNNIRQQLQVTEGEFWYMPDEMVATLDRLAADPHDHMIEQALAGPVRLWKQWVLLNPLRLFKYNLNNTSGDLDKVLAYDPRIFKMLYQTAKDLWKIRQSGELTPEFEEALRRGVFTSGRTITEVDDIRKFTDFDALERKAKGKKNPAAWAFDAYWSRAKGFTEYREEIARFAVYRHVLKQLLDGQTMQDVGYGAANREMVDGLGDHLQRGDDGQLTSEAIEIAKDKAALLSRELIGDYGAISKFGQEMRTKLVPFYSWIEVNTKAYNRLIGNAVAEGKYKEAGIASAVVTSKVLARMAVMYGLVSMYNAIFFPEEEELLDPTERLKLHLNLGRTPDNEIISLKFQGALSDYLGWIGFSDVVPLVAQLDSGRASWDDIAAAIMKAPVNKVASGLTPVLTTPFIMASGQTYWPDIFNPRPVKDRPRELAKLVSAEDMYDWFLGRPTREWDYYAVKPFVYTRDPGEMQYYRIKKMVGDWNKRERGKEPGFGSPSSPRAEALYLYRLAVRFKDKEAQRKYFAKVVEYGGDLKTSVRMAHPLSQMAIKDREEFLRSLTPAERRMLINATNWYKQLYRVQ